jgi:hypothetical protein
MLTTEAIDRIVQFDGGGLPVTSLYVDVDPGPGGRTELRARVSSLLDQARALGRDTSLDRESRLSVRADFERIRQAQGEQRWRPRAVAIFACSGRGLFEDAALPRNGARADRGGRGALRPPAARGPQRISPQLRRGDRQGLGQDLRDLPGRDAGGQRGARREAAQTQISPRASARIMSAAAAPRSWTATNARRPGSWRTTCWPARVAAARQAVAGLEECLWAGSVAAVRSLVLAEGAEVPGVVCERSDWLALSGAACRCARGAPGTLRM